MAKKGYSLQEIAKAAGHQSNINHDEIHPFEGGGYTRSYWRVWAENERNSFKNTSKILQRIM